MREVAAVSAKAIFIAAARISDSDVRAKYVEEACGSDSDLRRKVDELLAMENGNVENPLDRFLARFSPAETENISLPLEAIEKSLPLSHVGPYKLLEQIGEGGMGLVYMAEQSKPVRRRVALKLIKPGMDTKQVLARFEAERQALAIMEHPNIARVLDAGTTDQARPYFVMELVRGIPINEFCNQAQLSTRERLALFKDVCAAVQHAHMRGIIHRDLKPTNVLVTMNDDKPLVKVIDFGIAKATNQQLTERTLFTAFQQMIGTPMYMSPEQAQMNNMDVDTRSDVYSLGVMLYEILTGELPFDRDQLQRSGFEGFRKLILETDPPRPSQRISTLRADQLSTASKQRKVDTRRFSQTLKGELDWIVMKAIEKDRRRRYNSASELAADIDRYLNDEPVQACPPSINYRLSKFARRYRAPLTTASILLFMMFAATAFSIHYAYIADAARRDSVDHRLKTENALSVAEMERNNADRQRQIADERRVKAEQLEAEAVTQRDLVKRNLYTSDIRLASADLRDRNVARLYQKLDSHLPDRDAWDNRGWEWYYLLGASHLESRTLFKSLAALDNASWSPDGKRIVSMGLDSMIRFWGSKTGELMESLDAESIRNVGVVWSPNGSTVAFGYYGDQGGISLLDTESKLIRQMPWDNPSLPPNVCHLAWSPDGHRLAAGYQDGTCRIWDMYTYKCQCELAAQCMHVSGVSWSPDGRFVATAGKHLGGGLRIWDSNSGSQVVEMYLTEDFGAVSFDRSGEYLIAGRLNGSCELIRTDGWQSFKQIEAHKGSVTAIAPNPRDDIFLTSGTDGLVHAWRLPDGALVSSFLGHDAGVNSVHWNPNGKDFVSSGLDNMSLIWSAKPDSVIRKIEITGNSHVNELAKESFDGDVFYPENSGTAIVTDFERNAIRVLDPIGRLAVTEVMPDDIAIIDYLKVAIHGKAMRPHRLYNLPIKNLSTDFGFIWSPDESLVLFARRSFFEDAVKNELRFDVWNAITQEKVYSWRTCDGDFDCAWASDNRRIAVSAHLTYPNGWVSVVDVIDGKFIHRIQHAIGSEHAVAWNSDCTRIASGNSNGVVSIWDAKTGAMHSSMLVHRSLVKSLAWSPDNNRIATASSDGHVRIVDAETLEELLSLTEGTTTVTQLSWSKDGRQLYGLDDNQSIVIWSASHGYDHAVSNDYVLERKSREDRTNKQTLINLHTSRPSEALRLIDAILVSNPENQKAWFDRGNIQLSLKDYQSAIRSFDRVIRLHPDHQAAWNQRGIVELRLEHFSDAIESFTSAINCNPTTSQTPRMNRARSHLAMEQFSKALEDFRIAFDNFKSFDAGRCVALLHLEMGEIESFNSVVKELLDRVNVTASDRDKEFVLWTCHERLVAPEHLERSLKIAESIHKNHARYPESGRWMGYTLYRLGRYDESLEYLSRALEPIPNISSVYCYYFMAMLQQRLGNHDSAMEWLDKANAECDKELAADKRPDWFQSTGMRKLRNEATDVVNAL